ncbi:MAG: hypothetical protein DSY43_01895 [Gammaproteobacteria bacterium]|nr:MAG: hypothetical protein DSY43_01895 [Gammaproteobacteria bacterium]
MKEGKLTLSAATARRRRNEVYKAAEAVHGSTKTSTDIGLADTVVNKCSTATINNVFSSNSKFRKQVVPSLYKPHLVNYEKSNSNMLRSVSTYYSGGVMGKQKYRSVYKNSSYANGKRITVNNCPIPRLVPYNKLMPFIKSIDIGKLYSVRETLCDGLKEDEKVVGVYRSLKELLLKLATFYLHQDVHKLIWFKGQTNTFFVSLGGDGAPFGKDDVATAWLVSFLNVGRGVLSSNENFLLFGANCTENAIPVQRFIRVLVNEICDIEKSSYTVHVNTSAVTVKFHFAELPNDMKMLAFLAGELSNSAKYFSTFANVNYDSAKTSSGSFSLGTGTTWSPWSYQHRLQVAKQVADLKETISKKKLALQL